MNTQTLDERIRAKSKADLEKEILAMFLPIFDKLRTTERRKFSIKKWVGTKEELLEFDMWDHLRTVKDKFVELIAPDAEEAAVAAFVQKVESLQEQIDSLNIQQ
jgi:hypothetical protein